MIKTDNSHLREKILLRQETVKDGYNVLDCFAGTGLIWSNVKGSFSVVSIEKEKGKNKLALCGDNVKFLKMMDLSKYHIIDLDAYGIPFAQLEVIFQKRYKGIVHVTAIQTGTGKLPNGLLEKLGYTKKMIEKISTLFNADGFGKLKKYLYLRGVKQITGYQVGRKNYFYFKTV